MKAILTTKNRWHLVDSISEIRMGKYYTLCNKHIIPVSMIEYEGQTLKDFCISCEQRNTDRNRNTNIW
jgi:hypothetical protein